MPQAGEFKQLRWRCRRGMRELDSVLLHYLEYHYEQAGPDQRQAFQALLNMHDPELYFLVLGKTHSDNKDISRVVAQLQQVPRG